MSLLLVHSNFSKRVAAWFLGELDVFRYVNSWNITLKNSWYIITIEILPYITPGILFCITPGILPYITLGILAYITRGILPCLNSWVSIGKTGLDLHTFTVVLNIHFYLIYLPACNKSSLAFGSLTVY